MADFDPDSHLDERVATDTEGFDPDSHLDSPDVGKSISKPSTPEKRGYFSKYFGGIKSAFKGLGNQLADSPLKSAATAIPGALETVASPASTALADASAVVHSGLDKTLGLVPGAGRIGFDPAVPFSQRRDEYEGGLHAAPETAMGEKLTGAVGSVLKPVGDVVGLAGKATGWLADAVGASEENAKSVEEQTNAVVNAALLAGGVRKSAKKEPVAPSSELGKAQEILNKTFSSKSVGAAEAAPDISKATPEMQQAVVNAAKKLGGNINPKVLAKQLEADSLPVPVRLTEGMVSDDMALKSLERNNRGKFPQIAKAINDVDNALKENVTVMRDKVGPDVFTTNHVEHGDALIGAYKAKAAVADQDISAKYKALKDANGGEFPVSAPQLLESAAKELHKSLLFDHAPPAIMKTLDRLAKSDSMTFENFESLRTNLARIQRSAVDGNERAAAGVIRNAMEELPLSNGAEALKPLADSARSAAKAQFKALESDPAYKAAVTDSVTPDKFVSKFIIGGSRDTVKTMRENLSHSNEATQTMGVAALDHLREQAGIDRQGNGSFKAANFNKNLEKLDTKLQALFAPEDAEVLAKLGRVARNATEQPVGSFVNNSNTFVASAADKVASAAEGATNVAFKGVPVGTWTRKIAQARSESKAVQRATEIGAGLATPTKLNELLKPQKTTKQ